MLIVTGAGFAWALLAFWVTFIDDGYMTLVLILMTLISAVMLGLLTVGGDGGRNVTPWQRPWRSFGEFLDGEVEVRGTRLRGRDAFIQLAGVAWCLAGLATAFGIIMLARPATGA